MNQNRREKTTGTRLALLVSIVLQVGVLLSAAIILIGLIRFLSHGTIGSYHYATSDAFSFPHTPKTLMSSLRSGSGLGLIELGVLLLILTPVVRVAVSILSFLVMRERQMTLITLFVLIVLLSSFWLGALVR